MILMGHTCRDVPIWYMGNTYKDGGSSNKDAWFNIEVFISFLMVFIA